MPIFDASSAQSLPAPFWFVELFKTLGFALHLIPMGLLLIGVPFSLLFWIAGGVNSKRLAQRFFQQVPIIIALGINFGIVPLLFVQLGYSRAFYTATTLVGGHWIAILPVALVAYYASYLCAKGAKKERIWSTAFFACVASVCFLAIGLVFTSVWTLFERPYEWESVWRESARSFPFLGGLTFGGWGTASGLGLYWKDTTIFIRFAGVLGLAFFATSAWIVFDAYYVYRGPRPLTKEELARLRDDEYSEAEEEKKRKKTRKPIQENRETFPFWALSVACVFVFLGLAVTIPALGKYLLASGEELKNEETWNSTLWNVLCGALVGSLVLPPLFLIVAKFRKMSGRTLAAFTTFFELVTVGSYASLRQILQNARLRPYYDPANFASPDAVQWTPILAFLGVFAVVAVLVVIMISLMAASSDKSGKKKGKKSKKESDNSSDESKDSVKKNKEGKSTSQEGFRDSRKVGSAGISVGKGGMRRL